MLWKLSNILLVLPPTVSFLYYMSGCSQPLQQIDNKREERVWKRSDWPEESTDIQLKQPITDIQDSLQG